MSAQKQRSTKDEAETATADVVSALQYEFEDPARSWIDLVVATRILEEKKRKSAVYVMLNEAKNSHWTHDLLDAEIELETDAEYGGSYDADPGGDYTEETEAPSDPEEGMNQVDRDVDFRTKVMARPAIYCGRCGQLAIDCRCGTTF